MPDIRNNKQPVSLIDTEVYAGRLKARNALLESSSGGAFTALSDYFLREGNAVCCCVYNYKNHTAEFKLFTDDIYFCCYLRNEFSEGMVAL